MAGKIGALWLLMGLARELRTLVGRGRSGHDHFI